MMIEDKLEMCSGALGERLAKKSSDESGTPRKGLHWT